MNYIRKNLNNLKKVLSVLTFLGMMLSSFGTLAMPQVAEATSGGNDNKVTICHYNSGEKTYTQNSVSKNSIEKKNGDDGGHGNHENDIIPPFDGFNDGLNWDVDGQAIYDNDCKVPTDNNSGGGNTGSESGNNGGSAKLHVTKIVCEDPAKLPAWGGRER